MTKHRESDSAEAGRGDAPIAPPYGPRPRGERVKSLFTFARTVMTETGRCLLRACRVGCCL